MMQARSGSPHWILPRNNANAIATTNTQDEAPTRFSFDFTKSGVFLISAAFLRHSRQSIELNHPLDQPKAILEERLSKCGLMNLTGVMV